jgi:phosphoribosylglycinamide formyltransferase 1
MSRLAVFASGNGSNAKRIIDYFHGHPDISIDFLLCNKEGAPVLSRVENTGVAVRVFTRTAFYETNDIPELLMSARIDFLILAGFLWLVPQSLLNIYPGRIINIHPALLPKFGGKGMYGMKVHEAVIKAGENESGITIHYVDENYDEGRIIFQARCPVAKEDTPLSLAGKVHALEMRHYPEIIEKIVTRDT